MSELEDLRQVVSDHDPQVHYAELAGDEALCGAPVLMELGPHPARLVVCPDCLAHRLDALLACLARHGDGPASDNQERP